MDLSKVTFPTFVLEPRSMLIFGWVCRLLVFLRWLRLRRGTRAPLTPNTCCSLLGSAAAPGLTLCVNFRFFFAVLPSCLPVSPERLLIFTFRHIRSAELCEEPEERFIRVLQYYLAGWHIKPKGVKKP
jgi:hypothetical protein